jgi:nucleotide-binding universal stress UspA family protein
MKENLRIRRILFATDFLESSRLALDYAVVFAHRFNATLVLLHAIELPSSAEAAELVTSRASLSREAAEARLEAFATGVRRTGIEVDHLVKDGTPCQVVLDAVKEMSPDLLILGVHGVHRGIGHLLIGSNTEKILLSVSCPTLSVGAHALAGIDLRLDLNEILYCSDFTPQAAAAAPYALWLGVEFNVQVEVCHLAPTPLEENADTALTTAELYCDELRRYAPEIAESWCAPAFQLRHGLTLHQIINRAEAATAGLIVLGVHAASQLGRHLHTSFAYQLLTKAVCPVLTIGARDHHD